MNVPDDQVAKVWYREPWFWMVLAPLIAVVFSSATMVFLAVTSADDVVSDDYYKEGRLLAQEFTSEEHAKSLGLQGDISFDWLTHEVILRLNKNITADQLSLLVSHPAKSKYDRTLILQRVAPSLFRADLDEILQGRWYLRLSAYKKLSKQEDPLASNAGERESGGAVLEEIWRLNGEVDFVDTTDVVLE